MAHYKRKKCRYHSTGTRHRGSQTTLRARLGMKPVRIRGWYLWDDVNVHEIWPHWFNWYDSAPAHWDRTFHTRPHRMRTKRMERQILMGLVDPDDANWPIPNRPQVWYY